MFLFFLQQAEAEACGVAKVLLAPAMINAAAAHARRRGGTPEQPPRLPARWHRALSWPWGRKKKGVGAPVASVCLLLEASLGLQRVCFGFRVPRRERELGTPPLHEDFGSWSGVPPGWVSRHRPVCCRNCPQSASPCTVGHQEVSRGRGAGSGAKPNARGVGESPNFWGVLESRLRFQAPGVIGDAAPGSKTPQKQAKNPTPLLPLSAGGLPGPAPERPGFP